MRFRLMSATVVATAVALSTAGQFARGQPPGPSTRPAVTVRLGDGVTVTIDALASVDHPDPLWAPDGSPVVRPPWRLPADVGDVAAKFNQAGAVRYAVVQHFAWTGPDEPHGFAYDLNGAAGGQYLTCTPEPIGPLGDHERIFGATIPVKPDVPTATLGFLVAAGPFTPGPVPPQVNDFGQGIAVTGSSPAGRYVIGRPLHKDGRLVLPVATAVKDYDKRVVVTVEDGQGRTRRVVAQGIDGDQSGDLSLDLYAVPGVTDERSIRGMVMEFRPWVAVFVDGVSLRPGRLTRPTVSARMLATTRPDGTTDDVAVGGDVGMPGLYRLSALPRQSVTALLEAAGRAGGAGDVVSVRRLAADGFEPVLADTPVGQVTPGSAADLRLRAQDQIMVMPRP